MRVWRFGIGWRKEIYFLTVFSVYYAAGPFGRLWELHSWPYHSLKNVISTKDKFFFFQSDGTFLFLPKAIFQSEEEIEAFSRFLRSRGVEFQENMTAESVR